MQINIKFFNNSFHLSKATQTLVLIMERERERERENFYLLRASGGWSISSTLSLPIIPWVHCSLLSSCIVLSETPVWQKKQTIQIVMHTFYVCTFKSYFISQMHFIQTLKQLHCIYTLCSIRKTLTNTWKNFQQRHCYVFSTIYKSIYMYCTNDCTLYRDALCQRLL